MVRVLIAEDEPGVRETLEAGLKMRGYDTILAVNGEEAFRLATKHDPDIILLDVLMPKMNGLEVCRKLKASLKTFVPIIMVTAKADLSDKVEGVNKGADDYLTKPFRIEELIARITSMLRIKSQHDNLKKISLTDFLTGTYNRRFLHTRIKEEYSRAKRHGIPFTCLMLDLDNFKSINDTYGHQFGDTVLKHVVGLLKNFIRPTDVLVRYGGDEFLLLLPETRLESAKVLAERIRSALEAQEVREGDFSVKVACSIGVGSFPGPRVEEPEDLIANVDKMLYDAKKNGRNRVSVFNPENS